MKCAMVGVMALAAAMFAASAKPNGSPKQQTPAATAARIPVIVELFTSEGCSDCPPADKLLAQLQAQQPIAGAEVIALEEHVDYWDHQGWIDPFSSPEWTHRQNTYIAKAKGATAFTPEMVVDGRWQFTGSNEKHADEAVELAERLPMTDVSIAAPTADPGNEQKYDVKVGPLAGATPGDTAEVWLAVTQSGLHKDVTGGENKGRDVEHSAVVRMFRKLGDAKEAANGASFDGSAVVKFKSDWDRANVMVVVFVQERKSLHILGSAAVKAAA